MAALPPVTPVRLVSEGAQLGVQVRKVTGLAEEKGQLSAFESGE